jgi:hypothetical protein
VVWFEVSWAVPAMASAEVESWRDESARARAESASALTVPRMDSVALLTAWPI